MYSLNPTKKFLSFTVNHGGAGFSSYGTDAKSGHFYYSNNVGSPWGNDKTHIGSFDLKTAGSTTFVIGEAADAAGTILANKQKYTSMCNLFSAGTLDYHFLTIVIDRPKPSEYINGSCPSSYTFLDGYEHPQVTLTITPYYINNSNTLIAGSSIATSYWDNSDFSANSNCYNLRANRPYSATLPDEVNNYQAGGLLNYWTAGNVVMPQHGCKAAGPAANAFSISGIFFEGTFHPQQKYYFYGISPTSPVGCVNAALYKFVLNDGHYWGTQFSNRAPDGTVQFGAKITKSTTKYGAGVATYYNNQSVWNALNMNAGTYQCSNPNPPYSPNGTFPDRYAFPRYMPDVQSRCNQGARTSTQSPYYVGTSHPVYGGYGFYMSFIWDALCYPCG
jgi:hypothetical protein